MFKQYCRLSTQKSLLAVLRKPYRTVGIKCRFDTRQAPNLLYYHSESLCSSSLGDLDFTSVVFSRYSNYTGKNVGEHRKITFLLLSLSDTLTPYILEENSTLLCILPTGESPYWGGPMGLIRRRGIPPTTLKKCAEQVRESGSPWGKVWKQLLLPTQMDRVDGRGGLFVSEYV